jgi:DNA polymerase-3 subunit beta
MEFTIKQKDLNEALSAAITCISGKNVVIPVLQNILIESVGENAVRMTATDFNLTIRRTAEADIIKPGSLLIQAKKLLDIVRSLPEGNCHFETDKKCWTTVTHGRSKFRFAGTKVTDFPEISSHKDAGVNVPAGILAELVGKVAFAVAGPKSGQGYAIKDNIKLEIKNDLIRLVAIEGRMMSIAEKPLDANADVDRVVQKKLLIEAAKIADGDLRIWGDDNHIFIESDDQLLISRCVTAQFPNYEMALPSDLSELITFDCEAMRLAIRRAAVMADSRHLSIRMEIKSGEIEITSRTRDEGDAVEVVDTNYDGAPIKFGFFHQYLTDFLSVANSKEPITFAWSERPNAPALMGVKGDTGFRFVIVPLNLEVSERIEEHKAQQAAQVQ